MASWQPVGSLRNNWYHTTVSIHLSLSLVFFSLWLTLISSHHSISFFRTISPTHTHTHTHYCSTTQHPLTPDHVSRLPGWYRTVCPYRACLHGPQLRSVVVMIIETFTPFSSTVCTSRCCLEQAPRPTGWKTRSDFHISALFTKPCKVRVLILFWKTSNDRLAGGRQSNKDGISVV